MSHVAFVRHHPDLAGDLLLREDDAVVHKLTLRAEVQSVVQLARPSTGDELVAKVSDLNVHYETFQIDMG